MNINVINEYRQWAERQLVDRKYVVCPRCELYLVPEIKPLGISLFCVLCSYFKDLGYGEYLMLEKENIRARNKFNGF